MKKTVLMKSFAVVAIGMAVASCSSEIEYSKLSNEQLLENAEQRLGFEIDPAQSWQMVGQKTMSVNVGQGTYNVRVLTGSPFAPGTYKLAEMEGVSGTQNITFNYALASDMVYVEREDAQLNKQIVGVSLSDNSVSWDGTSKARTRNMTRSDDSDIVITYDEPAASVFVTSLPAGVKAISSVNGWEKESSGTSYQVGDGDDISGFWQSDMTFYVNGDATISISGQLPNDTKIYILPGAKLTAKCQVDLGYNGVLSLAPATDDKAAAQYKSDYQLRPQSNSNIFNKGTIDIKDLWSVSTGQTFNYGTIQTGTDGVYFTNECKLVNKGTIASRGRMKFDAATKLVNEGSIKVDGEFIMTNSVENIIENRGYFKAGTFHWTNATIYNNCSMFFDAVYATSGDGGKCVLNNREESYFYVKGDMTESAQKGMTNITFNLDNGSVVAVDGNASMKWNVNINGIGSSKKALFAVKGKVSYGSGSGITGGATYAGNLYFGVGRHEQCQGDNCTRYWYVDGATEVEYKNITITKVPTEGSCGTAFTVDGGGNHIVVNNQIYSYAYEDETPAGDYDLNDVVLQVRVNNSDDSKLDITVAALGGIRDVTLTLNGTTLRDNNGNTELHEILGVERGTMTNTGYAKATPKTLTVTLADYNLTKDQVASLPLVIHPTGMPDVAIATVGQDPHGVVIPAEWVWPRERICIKDAYPNFIEFAKNAATTDNTIKGWYNVQTDDNGNQVNPVASKLYNAE